MQIAHARPCGGIRVKGGLVFWCARPFEMFRSGLPRPKHPVDDKALAAIRIKNLATRQQVTRISPPRLQFLTTASDLKDNRVVAGPIIDTHVDPISANLRVRL